MRIDEVMQFIEDEGSSLAEPVPVEGMPPMTFACTFSPRGVSEEEISQLKIGCPPDLIEFWKRSSFARLFEDQEYGQWGLVILSPEEAAEETAFYQERRRKDFFKGDLVIGTFLGDQDLLVLRCDPACDDFGKVLVALPLDPREDWYVAAGTLVEFLDQYARGGGEKYWVSIGPGQTIPTI